ncbi:uncharacterized protein LOC108160500 isoform X2 [Drosophila miranda]|uniref:uncharacterized protein LOC108160500 isoform X2 n=1 Tax=Drosophila miranda TaxID=7229 RepID=UPI0007E6069B|nr:uncharacterized protein LOC108160500 isoform X2 [Drosophila miranda]
MERRAIMSDVEKAIQIRGKQRLPEDDGDVADEAGSGPGTGPCSVVGVKTTATLMAKKKSCPRRCLGQLLKLVLSTPGLMLLVTAYSVLGALIFPLLEAPQDLSKSAAIAKSREDCLRELWIITEKLNVLYERNWTMLVHEQLRRFEGSIVAATRQGATGVGGGASFQAASASALGHFGYDAGDTQIWTFSEALLYSVTVITTIGHGSLTPRTAAGKLATIFYALIGVPLMLMCLSSLGTQLAEALQCTYMRLCCQLQKHRQKKPPAQRGTASTATKASATPTTTTMAATATATKRRQAAAAAAAAGNGANCRSCKYDAANTETSLNESYEYGQGQAAARGKLPPDKGEDACQLLHNLNQQQQQQHFYQPQQQQQQHPDVMLMTTTTTGSAMLKYAPQQQQQQQQQQLSTATLPRQHHQHLHPQQQLQQNFVAVPSSMLRSMPLTMPPNCYGPATATIYFPFAPSAAGSPQHSQHLVGTAEPANGPGSGPGLGQQPLVKYHTIHLQPATAKHRLLAPARDEPLIAGQGTESTVTLEGITLPPPPAYQTASIHGWRTAVRRGKFVTKPLPHEINALMDSGTALGAVDLSSRHDLLPHAFTTAATSTAAAAAASGASSPALLTYTAAAMTATSPQLSGGIKAATGGGGGAATMSDNSFIAAGVCGMAAPATGSSAAAAGTATTPSTTSSAAGTLSTLLCPSATGNVDIMEDEDEQERERLSNCPHGTPSRVPLIASPLSGPQDSGERTGGSGGSGSRGLLNATAASFHRHTMQPLNRKKMLLTRRCQRHATAALYDGTATTTETSDDEEYMQQGSGSEQFVLRKLRYHSESEDGLDEETEDECEERQHRVPISLVLLILMCYISAGTVIFALWEDWSLVDGAYFCFVTLSTIGYGDFVPARSFNGPALQLYACCAYLLLGLVLVAMSFSILETQLMWKCRRIAVRLKLARTD